jgi:hypothetical protein
MAAGAEAQPIRCGRRPKIGSSVFARIIEVAICPNELKTALAWVKRELPNFALTGEGSSKFARASESPAWKRGCYILK